MKKWLSYLLAAAALATFAGCSNIDGGEIEGLADVNKYDADGYRTVTASVTGTTAEAIKAEYARTVLPTPQALDGANLVYVLEGTSTQGNAIAAYKVAVASNGSFTVSFPDESIWELTLTAYKDSAAAEDAAHVQEKAYKDGEDTKYAHNPVLTATTEIDLSTGTTPTLTFNMSVKGLETLGTVAIAATAGFNYPANSVAVTKYEIALYDIVTGAYIQSVEETPENLTTTKVAIDTSSTTTFTAHSFENVAPGEYLLGITFYNEYPADTFRKVGFWSDYIVVAPGQTTTFDKVVDGINEKPADPEDFMAQLVAGSEDNDSYLVKLTWDDKSTNESNFEIDLYEVLDAAKATALTTETIKTETNATLLARLGFKSLYSDADIQTYKVVDFKDGSRYYGGGSLFAGSETATLKLETGKLYEVVLRAALTAEDKSADVARIACTNAEEGNTAYTADNNHINRVRMSYIAQPYTMTVDTTSATEYTAYSIYTGNDIALLTTSDFTLSYNGENLAATMFKGWLDAANATTAAESTDYIATTTYTNKTVIADVSYDVSASASTYSYATDVTKTLVTLTAYAKADNAESTITISDAASASANATTNSKLKIAINDTATPPASPVYNSYRISVDGTSYTTTKECMLYLSRLASGTHNITAAGYKIDATGNTVAYSYSFTLTVQR